MRQSYTNPLRRITALVAMAGLLYSTESLAQTSQTGYTFKAQSELVLVNVTVRDKSGNLVRDLKPEDFTVLEDNKPQKVATFDIENTENVQQVPMQQANLLSVPATKAKTSADAPAASAQESAIKDRRLIILFFDLSSMQPDEIERSAQAAQDYVKKQMEPADLVSVVSLGDTTTVNQDFTADRDKLQAVLQSFNAGAGAGFELGSTGTTEGTADTGQSFTVDDTEYNIFNTDRRLQALRAVAEQVANVPQKKSLIYFSSGMQRTGIENQSQLRAAINAAVLANLSIYTMDIRGLQALPPGGEAQSASLRGTSAYSGKSQMNALDSNFQTQETLVTLAAETGGKAFLDSNDFGRVFKGVQDDTSMYYLLGYHSTNTAKDGKYRRITVKVNRPGVKVDFRRGYYAEADFRHSDKDNRERQLQEELSSEMPSTDLPVYLATAYFRVADNKYYVPVSLIVPGSEIPFSRNRDLDKATLDILGLVTTDEKKISRWRDPRHREAGGECVERSAAQERAVRHRLDAAAGQISPQSSGAGERGGTNGIVRDRLHYSRSEVHAAEDELDRDGQPTAGRAQERYRQSAGAKRAGDCAERDARLLIQAAPLSLLRGL